MSVTTTTANTLQTELDKGNANSMPNLAALMKLGTMFTPKKVTLTNSTVAATVTLSPPALIVTTCRVSDVTGAAGATGPRVMTDAGGTAVAPSSGIAGVALLSDDGTTITFEGTVKAAIVEYIPRSYTSMAALYPTG